MRGFWVAAKHLTYMAKTFSIGQEVNESPSACLGKLREAFKSYSPMDPEATEHRSEVTLAFVNQAALGISKSCKKIGGLASIKVGRPLKMDEKRQEKVKVVKREKDQRARVTADERWTCNMVWMLLTVSAMDPGKNNSTAWPRNRVRHSQRATD